MEKQDYRARLPQIGRLFQAAYRRAIPAGFLEWRYVEGAPDRAFVTLAEENGELIGHYAAVPVEICGYPTLRAAQVASVMTHPAFEGRGVFQRLAREHEEGLRAHGIDFAFAFPNRLSDPIFLSKLGWQPLCEIPTLCLRRAAFGASALTREPLTFDDDFSAADYGGLADRAALVSARRDNAFLRWRFRNHPLNLYRNLVVDGGRAPAAYAVVKSYVSEGQPSLDIVDYYAISREAFTRLMGGVLSYAEEIGAERIDTWALRHHVLHRYFTALGFAAEAPVTAVSFKSFNPGLTEALKLHSNWWLTMGDSDVY